MDIPPISKQVKRIIKAVYDCNDHAMFIAELAKFDSIPDGDPDLFADFLVEFEINGNPIFGYECSSSEIVNPDMIALTEYGMAIYELASELKLSNAKIAKRFWISTAISVAALIVSILAIVLG